MEIAFLNICSSLAEGELVLMAASGDEPRYGCAKLLMTGKSCSVLFVSELL